MIYKYRYAYSNRSKSDPQQKVTTDSTDGIVSEVFSVE